MSKIQLNVLGLSYSQTQSGAYALVLSEEDGDRRIPIIIGGYEAQAIAIELEGLKPPRPLTHDLFLKISEAVELNLKEINIYRLEEGIFYSELHLEQNEQTIKIDARTSDAIALALRFKCPIYTTSKILDKSGIILDFDDEKKVRKATSSKKIEPITAVSKNKDKFSKNTVTELNELMQKAISEENYELAKEIKDEISKRTTE